MLTNPIGEELYDDLRPLVDVWGDDIRSPAGHILVAKNHNPILLYRFDEASGTAVADAMGNNPGTAFNVTFGQPSLFGDTDTAGLFSGAANSEVMSSVGQGPAGINTVAVEARFSTTSNQGGGLFQLGNTNVIGGVPVNFDRHLWMSNDGKLHWGYYAVTSLFNAVDSPLPYNDGLSHHVIGFLSNGALYLYVDDALVASSTAHLGDLPQVHGSPDYWRIGRAYLQGWTNAPTNYSWTGVIDEPAVYYSAIDADDVNELSRIGGSLGDLEIYCNGIGAMIQPIDDISKDGPNGEPGWSQVLDLGRAEDGWLPWLGQWNGYRVAAKASTETQAAWSVRERGRVISRAANRRGTIALLRETIQEHLSGTKTVLIQERVGDAHTINVYVYSTEIADSTAIVQAAALSAKANGLIMNFTVLTGANYALLQASNTSYAIMTGKHANYNSVLTNPGL